MRFEVPQFIEIEDKIFGPFTWRQFVYITGGGGFGLVLYLLQVPFLIFILVGLPVVGLAAALAFYPVNNRPFSIFLESMMGYMTRKRMYLWRKRNKNTYNNELPESLDPSAMTTAAAVPSPSKGNISNLSRRLELRSMETQIPDVAAPQ